ncbi:FG-GAP-like repeat-containing protein, partial [Hymenobacter convexus]|uniref:FG-GAP-like repeat-containing protein n=1 Tax=Hymenobacter sp. CA1UV-4 TaxID=3063782 RepID=UPI00271333A0
IVTANTGSNTAGVLLGLASGGFAPVNNYPSGTGGSPLSVAVGDVNGDGRPDIVTANTGSNTAGVLLGLASGGFAPVSTYSTGTASGPDGIAVADVNGDGRPDLLTGNSRNGAVAVLLNTGTFTPLAATPAAAAAAEVTLFPNPARGSFAVQLPAAWGAAPVRAELLNALGQVVATRAAQPTAGATLTMETAGLNAGIYTLRLHAGGHALTKRVVVE